jgi:predicted Zn-dependent protease
MLENLAKLNVVRVGSTITFSSLKEIAYRIQESFQGLIEECKVLHYNSPLFDSIDAYKLTQVLNQAYAAHTLGVTDADLKTKDKEEFYNSIFGGKNPDNDVAVVSSNKLGVKQIQTNNDYDLYIDRTLKVCLHEEGHNFGLTDHASYRAADDGSLCPMTKGEFNKFGMKGYVEAVIDGRGEKFCEECQDFLNAVHRR